MNNTNNLTPWNGDVVRSNDSGITIIDSPQKTLDGFNDTLGTITSTIQTMHFNHLEVEKQIHSMDVQLTAYLANLKHQKEKSDKISVSLKEMHKSIGGLIAATTAIATKNNVTEKDFILMNVLLESAHKFLDSIDRALENLCNL